MSDLRNNLDHAKHAYQQLRYDGDLADDVFARLDAEQAASLRIDRPAARRLNWRPFLAIAAAAAVIATTVVTLTHTGRDQPNQEVAKDVVIPPTDVAPRPPVDEPTDFTVVPSYQSFAISVPTSLSLASVDEYDRQAEEQTKSTDTTGEATKTSVQ